MATKPPVAQKLCFCTCEQVLWGLALNALMALYDQRPFIISKYFWRLQPQILYHPVPIVLRLASMRKVPGETIENLNNLTYLGRHLLAKAGISNDIYHHLQCTSTAFGLLTKRAFEDHDVKPGTKLTVYQSVMIHVLPSFMFLRHGLPKQAMEI